MDIVIKIALSLIHQRGRLDFEKDVAHEIWSKLRHFRLCAFIYPLVSFVWEKDRAFTVYFTVNTDKIIKLRFIDIPEFIQLQNIIQKNSFRILFHKR